jgi:hypothetical protein
LGKYDSAKRFCTIDGKPTVDADKMPWFVSCVIAKIKVDYLGQLQNDSLKKD